jgi:hypothetical protein
MATINFCRRYWNGERKNGLPNARRESNSGGEIANEKDCAIPDGEYWD